MDKSKKELVTYGIAVTAIIAALGIAALYGTKSRENKIGFLKGPNY